jgi:hypothetical protein
MFVSVMKLVLFGVMVFLLGSICFAGATEAEVVLIGDIGSFSGAVLKIESPVTGAIGDKIYASEYLTNVGIIKFNIETALDEVFLNFIISKNGVVKDEFRDGPFVVNGSDILIDRREVVEREVTKEVEEAGEVVEVVEVVEVEEPVVVEDVVEDDSFGNKLSSVFLTGKAVFVDDDGSFNMGSSIGGSSLILILIIFVFMISRRGKEKEVEILSDDDKELAYMEKKVKLTEANISRVKEDVSKKKRLEEAKAKLSKKKKELASLEKKERRDSERIEDI